MTGAKARTSRAFAGVDGAWSNAYCHGVIHDIMARRRPKWFAFSCS